MFQRYSNSMSAISLVLFIIHLHIKLLAFSFAIKPSIHSSFYFSPIPFTRAYILGERDCLSNSNSVGLWQEQNCLHCCEYNCSYSAVITQEINHLFDAFSSNLLQINFSLCVPQNMNK